MDALTIKLGGEGRPHLRTHSVKLPARLASFSRNDALRANLLTDVPVVALAVELGIGHNGSNGVGWKHFIEQRSQSGAVIDRSLVSLLRQDDAQTRIDSQEPFEPVTPWHRRTAMLLASTNEKSADGSKIKPRGIYRRGAFGFDRGRLEALITAHNIGYNLGVHLIQDSQH